MNATTDLFPIGEAFAEMDLVVRQLDDGCLTVADDDSLPDDARLRILATDSGLKGEVRVTSAPDMTEGLSKALDFLNKDVRLGSFEWRGGMVWREAVLPWTPTEFTAAQLKDLYGTLFGDAQKHGSKLEGIATRGEEWTTISERAGKSAIGAPSSVPPSFLPGSGQKTDEDRATIRYGAVDKVPGRPELAAHERRPSQRPQPVGSRGGGGGGGAGKIVLVVVVMFVMFGGMAAGLVALNMTAEEDEPTDVVVVPPKDDPPVDPVDPVGDDDDDFEPIDLGGGDGAVDPGDDDDDDDTAPVDDDRNQRVDLGSEAGILKAMKSPNAGLRLQAVKAWARDGHDQAEGARLRMLTALDGRSDRDVSAVVLKSFRDNPVDPNEGLECLELATTGVRRLLIEQLGQPGHSPDDAAIIAEMLAELPETDDMLIDMALIRLGHPKPNAAKRLVDKRGVEWVQFGDGQKVLEQLAQSGVQHLKPLTKHPEEKVRVLVCKILVASKDRKVLAVLRPLLGDESPAVRRRAAEAMQELQNPKASWLLARQLILEKDRRTKEVIEGAISKLPPKATAKYLGALYKKDVKEDRMAAVKALYAMNRPEGVPGLVRSLRDKDAEILMESLTALRSLHKQPGMQDTVALALSDVRRLALDRSEDKQVRKTARQLHYKIAGRFPK